MLNKEIVFRDAYRLLCIFMADKAIFDMTPQDQQVWGGSQQSAEPLFRLRHQYIEDEVNHTLINLAICNRTHMDQQKEQHGIDFIESDCGILIKDLKAQESAVTLSFREACNKIIHADGFTATSLEDDMVVAVPKHMEPMHHEIWLSGQYGNKSWKAELDVLPFLRGTTKNFDLF